MLNREDLKVGMHVKVSDLVNICDTHIYLKDFVQKPVYGGEGIVAAFGPEPCCPGTDTFSFYMPYSVWLDAYDADDEEV